MLLCYAFKGAGKVFAKEQFAWMQKNICAYCLHKFEAVFILINVKCLKSGENGKEK